MAVLDPETHASLDRLVPHDTTPADWDDVLARSGRHRLRRIRPRLIAVAAAFAAAAAVVALSPWDRAANLTVVDQALAAIGDEPVLHAVIREHGESQFKLVEIASGQTTRRPLTIERELWYDPADALGHTIVRENGQVVDDTLQTPDGTTNMDGVVYTCAWIAAHPVEATKERISCRFDGNNGTTPRKIPEAPPTVDPALGAFLTGYREQLATGKAQRIGEGVVDGTPVYWVQLEPVEPAPIPGFEPPPGEEPSPPIAQRDAVDRDSYRPVLVQSVQGELRGEYRVLEIETVSKDEADFSEPPRRPPATEVSIGTVIDPKEATPSEAAAALGTTPLWLGGEYKGLRLTALRTVTLRTGYTRESGLEPRFDQGVEIVYGSLENGRPAADSVVLQEATVPAFAFGWDTGRVGAPPPGYMLMFGPGGLMKHGDLYLRLQSVDDGATLAAVARALVPMNE